MSDSNAASSAQTLLDALIELRRLGPAGVFSDSGRFRAVMLDLRPGLKKEVRVLSALIDAGYLQRLQDAAESEREIVSAQIRLWLDEELDLKSETAHNYSSVLLAFFSGAASMAAAGFPFAQSGTGAGVPFVASQPSASAVPSVPPKPSAPSLRDVYANKRVGERFEFGRYPQGKNGEVMPITWRVLGHDSDSLLVLVIAEKGLDCKPYHGTNVGNFAESRYPSSIPAASKR